MAKKNKQPEIDFYYMNYGQASNDEKDEKAKRKKAKEREKRIKENRAKQEESFDIDTETVIQMTNRNKIKQEEQRKRKLTQEEKRKKIRNKKIIIVLEILLLLGAIIGGITFAMVSPIFNIKEIQVVNNNHINSETIISLSEMQLDENIFRFNSGKVIKKIKENPYIKNVKIHRKIPNTIQIEVEERQHAYSVDFLGKYAYVDKQGYILEISEDNMQKMILQGIETKEEQVLEGARLNEEDLKKLEDVIKIMNATKEYELDTKVTSIDITNKNEYSIYLEQEKKKVYLGDNSNLGNKMLYVNAIIEKEKGKQGEIFANGDLNNKFRVYFRESLNV
ncbi:MAG: FtsQ-type POTRA domain-containing protein [Bacilli bacterium]|nr:FtsQ-type POTRA domain-containing protein [Bacilli bacterium]